MFPVPNSASNKKCRTNYKRDDWDFFNCYRCANLNATRISLQWWSIISCSATIYGRGNVIIFLSNKISNKIR